MILFISELAAKYLLLILHPLYCIASLPTVKGKTGVIAGAIIFKTANLLFGKVICLLENLSQLSYSYKTSLPAVVWFYMWCGVASRVTTS